MLRSMQNSLQHLGTSCTNVSIIVSVKRLSCVDRRAKETLIVKMIFFRVKIWASCWNIVINIKLSLTFLPSTETYIDNG